MAKPYRTVYLLPVFQKVITGWRWSLTDDGHEVDSGVEDTVDAAQKAGQLRKKELYGEES